METKSGRELVLEAAKTAVLQDRNVDYGNPEDNFQDIADMITIYLKNKKREGIRSEDIAVFGIIQKICRLKQSPERLDHYVDIAGYSACGYDCILAEDKKGIQFMNVVIDDNPLQYPTTNFLNQPTTGNLYPNWNDKNPIYCKQCRKYFNSLSELTSHHCKIF